MKAYTWLCDEVGNPKNWDTIEEEAQKLFPSVQVKIGHYATQDYFELIRENPSDFPESDWFILSGFVYFTTDEQAVMFKLMVNNGR